MSGCHCDSGGCQPAEGGKGIEKVNEIIENTIRPALQRDGGDMSVVGLEGNVLRIKYQGACGCCPHAATGTLNAIQDVLRKEYDPDIVVEMA